MSREEFLSAFRLSVDWVGLGVVELGLDCLRRYVQALPITERADFERV